MTSFVGANCVRPHYYRTDLQHSALNGDLSDEHSKYRKTETPLLTRFPFSSFGWFVIDFAKSYFTKSGVKSVLDFHTTLVFTPVPRVLPETVKVAPSAIVI